MIKEKFWISSCLSPGDQLIKLLLKKTRGFLGLSVNINIFIYTYKQCVNLKLNLLPG